MAYVGGSAASMANSLMEGYMLPSPTNLKRLTVEELRSVLFEVEKLLRDMRAVVPDQQDTMALLKRNQRLLKLNQSQLAMNNYLALKIKGRV
jgi:hypothetical protein